MDECDRLGKALEEIQKKPMGRETAFDMREIAAAALEEKSLCASAPCAMSEPMSEEDEQLVRHDSALRAEVEREKERADAERAARLETDDAIHEIEGQKHSIAAERDALRAEVERLRVAREALAEIAEANDYAEYHSLCIAREALERTKP
jgi:septal ring factor EnvC (AmiA/AmiB activator)